MGLWRFWRSAGWSTERLVLGNDSAGSAAVSLTRFRERVQVVNLERFNLDEFSFFQKVYRRRGMLMVQPNGHRISDPIRNADTSDPYEFSFISGSKFGCESSWQSHGLM